MERMRLMMLTQAAWPRSTSASEMLMACSSEPAVVSTRTMGSMGILSSSPNAHRIGADPGSVKKRRGGARRFRAPRLGVNWHHDRNPRCRPPLDRLAVEALVGAPGEAPEPRGG